MAKFWASASSFTKLTIIAFVLGLLWVGFGGSGDAPKSVAKKPVAKKSSSASATQFTDEDYKAKYAVYTASAKDSFKPLVARSGRGGPGDETKEDAIPAYMAGGDANWTYTGTAEVDSVPSALFENSATNDGVFVKQGEHWKDLVVDQISPESVVIKSVDGETVTLRLAAPVSPEEVKPVTPALEGPIGDATFGGAAGIPGAMNNVQVDPNAADATAPVVAVQGGPARGFGGRGGGRRGGRRGGGGG